MRYTLKKTASLFMVLVLFLMSGCSSPKMINSEEESLLDPDHPVTIQIKRNTPITFPRIVTSFTIIGSILSFSGWRR